MSRATAHLAADLETQIDWYKDGQFWKGDTSVGRLVQPFALTATAGYRYWVVIAAARRGVPKIKRFREWLLRQVEAGPVDAA